MFTVLRIPGRERPMYESKVGDAFSGIGVEIPFKTTGTNGRIMLSVAIHGVAQKP